MMAKHSAKDLKVDFFAKYLGFWHWHRKNAAIFLFCVRWLFKLALWLMLCKGEDH